MAGSLNHIVDPETGKFDMSGIENLGDADEALEECFEIIRFLTGGEARKINLVCRRLSFPTIKRDLTQGRIDD